MAEELQGLLDRIQSEGIAKAEAEKTKIVEDAKAEAAKIVAAAKEEAASIVKKAKPRATPQSNRRRAMCSSLSARISKRV